MVKIIRYMIIAVIFAVAFFRIPDIQKNDDSDEEKYLYLALDDEKMENIEKELPLKIQVIIDHGGEKECMELTQKEKIEEAVACFMEILVEKETYTVATDSYNALIFTFQNEETVYISLNGTNLEQKIDESWHYYELEGLTEFLKKVRELEAR